MPEARLVNGHPFIEDLLAETDAGYEDRTGWTGCPWMPVDVVRLTGGDE
ncbi:hypothetical protein KAU45_05360 [bacterium]|nr:hypothetical protein [bacterium]